MCEVKIVELKKYVNVNCGVGVTLHLNCVHKKFQDKWVKNSS